MTTAVVVEVQSHNSVVAGNGRAGESEWTLAVPLLAALRISFAKLLWGTQSIDLTVAVGDGVITGEQLHTLVTRSFAVLSA